MVRRSQMILLAGWLAVAPTAARASGNAASASRADEAVADRLVKSGLDVEAINRALREETNRVRREHGRKPLRARSELDAAADDQAAFMALRMLVQHESFLRGQATPAERVLRHGVDALAVAENVASTPLGREPSPKPPEMIAAQLVDQWMNSPGHRANLLDRRLTHFGAAVRVARLGDQWTAYGAQVFMIAPPPFGRVTRGGM